MKSKANNMMIKAAIFTFLIVLCNMTYAQVAINEDNADPDANAALDIKVEAATNPKGILIPNLSETQRGNLPSPAQGLMIFNRTTGNFNYSDGSNWFEVASTEGDAGSGNNTSSPNNDEVGVGVGIEDPYNSAILHINSNNKGLLLPRLAADIGGASEGTIYYNTTDDKIKVYDGTVWQAFSGASQALVNSGTGTASGVIIGSGTVDQSAKLEIKSTDKGLLIPRLTTTQRDNIIEVIEGLTIYNTTVHELQYYVQGHWYTCDYE